MGEVGIASRNVSLATPRRR